MSGIVDANGEPWSPEPSGERITASANVPRGRDLHDLARVVAGYDAAKTTTNNAKHWADADGLSPSSANSEQVRDILRRRARHETANNPIARGMVCTVADDTIGTGPRPHIRTGPGRSDTDKAVQDLFTEWQESRGLGDRMITLRKTKVSSGEGFVYLGRRRRRPASMIDGSLDRIELDPKLVEADQIAHPAMEISPEPGSVSGIDFDAWGDPIRYHMLYSHPGERGALAAPDLDARQIPASLMLHYFDQERPGDARGVPEITAALDLFALLRRFTVATVEAAEHMANIAGLLYTDAPANGDAQPGDAFDVIDFVRGMIMQLPDGWKYTQPDAKQPSSTYIEFKNAIIAEIARVLRLPFNVAAGDSSNLNYASGRMDHQVYHKSIFVERSKLVRVVLNPIFRAWYEEASLVEGYLPAEARTRDYARRMLSSIVWHWDGFGHVDPLKEAQAEAIRLESGSLSIAETRARHGDDWRDHLEQIARERQFREQLGIPDPSYLRDPAISPAGVQGGDE